MRLMKKCTAIMLIAAFMVLQLTGVVSAKEIVVEQEPATAVDIIDIVKRDSRLMAEDGRMRNVAWRAELEVREYLRTHDETLAQKAIARLEAIADVYHEGKTQVIMDEISGWFFEKYPFYYTCNKLEELGMLSDSLKKRLAPIREIKAETVNKMKDIELGANNRPMNFCGDGLMYAIMNPDSPLADDFIDFAEATWNEWYEQGSTTETMPSYNRIMYIQIFNLAELLGKEDELLERKDEIMRYFTFISGNGVRGGESENMGSLMYNGDTGLKVSDWYGLTDMWSDPWGVTSTKEVVQGLVRATYIFDEPEFIWYVRNVLCNGDVPDEMLAPPVLEMLDARLAEFERAGIELEVPETKSFISYLHYKSKPVEERVILTPRTGGPQPFVATYVNHYATGFMHSPTNQTGKVYEYSVDGSLLLRQGSKYSESAQENFVVMRPAYQSFPELNNGTRVSQKADYNDVIKPNEWNTMTGTLINARSRWAPDDEYYHDYKETLMYEGCYFVATQYEGMENHTLWGNYNTYNYKGDELMPYYPIRFDVPHPTIGLLSSTNTTDYIPGRTEPIQVLIQNIKLVGPKGEKSIYDLSKLGDDVGIIFAPADLEGERRLIEGEERNKFVEVVEGSEPGTSAYKLTLYPGSTFLVFPGLEEKFNLRTDYTRISIDFKYLCSTQGWKKVPIGLGNRADAWDGAIFGDSQGAILDPDNTVVEQVEGDSFSNIAFTNVWTAGTKWDRRMLLTEEGVLIVSDDIIPDEEADGWNVAPLWHVGPEWKKTNSTQEPSTEIPKQGDTWFDAPAFNRAYWQNNPKRLFLYYVPQDDMTIEMEKTDTTWASSYATYQKTTAKANEMTRFVTVMVPHDAKVSTDEILKNFEAKLDKDGNINVSYNDVKVSLTADNKWSVTRSEESLDNLRNFKLRINEKDIPDAPSPIIKNGKTLVPMRTVFEELGMKVEWDSETNTATASKGDTIIKIKENAEFININDNIKKFAVKPSVIDGVFMIPMSFLTDALGAVVNWDWNAKTATIKTGSITSSPTFLNSTDLIKFENYFSEEDEEDKDEDDEEKVESVVIIDSKLTGETINDESLDDEYSDAMAYSNMAVWTTVFSKNVFANGSFEIEGEKPSVWLWDDKTTSVTLDESIVKSGFRSAKISATGNGKAIIAYPKVNISPLKTYVFSSYVKTDGARSDVTVRIKFKDVLTDKIIENVETKTLSANEDGWTLFEFEFNTPKDIESIESFTIECSGNSSIWIDDITLAERLEYYKDFWR